MTWTSKDRSLSLLVFEESSEELGVHRVVVQCLEHDIAAGGDTIRAALESFALLISAHVADDEEKGREPLALMSRAPCYYWDRAAAAAKRDDEL